MNTRLDSEGFFPFETVRGLKFHKDAFASVFAPAKKPDECDAYVFGLADGRGGPCAWPKGHKGAHSRVAPDVLHGFGYPTRSLFSLLNMPGAE